MIKTSKSPISRYEFIKDRARGLIGEKTAESFLKKELQFEVLNVSDKSREFDFIIKDVTRECKDSSTKTVKSLLKSKFKESFKFGNKKEVTVEVKYDITAARTKNLFIEVFFNVDKTEAGALFKCKADILMWVIPQEEKYKILIFKRADLIAWIFKHLFCTKELKLKVPGVSPYARGVVIPINKISKDPVCIGNYDFSL